MKIELEIPDSIIDSKAVSITEAMEFQFFLQRMVNRWIVGAVRYNKYPNWRAKYLSRLKKELRKYTQLGNFEQLLNVANYAFLESRAPENKKLHFDPSVPSFTRGFFDDGNEKHR